MAINTRGAKVLVFDIETAPILAYVWGLWENNVALNQIKSDWHIMSWAAKWVGQSEVMYMDQRHAKDISDDRTILKGIWKLLDEADIVITQNGKKFDQKKLNARFILNGMKPPSPYKHIDTRELAKKHFGFTSNKLEYMTHKLNTKYKKIKHSEFGGQELWNECLKGNIKAWKEMEKYNKHDVLATEELYEKFAPWDSSIDFNLYSNTDNVICSCGNGKFQKYGYKFTSKGKYQKYLCTSCGKITRDSTNLFSLIKRKSLRSSAA